MSIQLTNYTEGKTLNGSSAAVHDRAELTIQNVKERTFEQSGDTKVVLGFLEISQELVLNKTRLLTVIGLFGDDTDRWKGRRIKLFPTKVNFGGKQVVSISIAAASTGKGADAVDVVFDDK